MANLFSRRSGLAGAGLVGLAAAIIGCGGGGNGGGGTSSSASASADGGGGLTNGGSGGTNGTPGGLLITDTIYYPTANADFSAFDVKYSKADGSGQGTFATDVPVDNAAAAPDPSVANRFAFAAIPAGGTKYGIYVGTNPTNPAAAGTITIASPRYAKVPMVQIARDGSKVVYIARTTSAGTNQLYEAPVAASPTLLQLGQADAASLSPNGDRVVYAAVPDGESDTELFVRVFAEANPHRVTQNTVFDLDPQFNHAGTKVVFSQEFKPSADVTRYRLAVVDLTVTNPTPTILDPSPTLDQESAPTLNAAETKIAYIGIGSAIGATGLYVADFPSGANATKVLSDDNIGYGAYWTNLQGRGFDRLSLNLSVRKR